MATRRFTLKVERLGADGSWQSDGSVITVDVSSMDELRAELRCASTTVLSIFDAFENEPEWRHWPQSHPLPAGPGGGFSSGLATESEEECACVCPDVQSGPWPREAGYPTAWLTSQASIQLLNSS